METASRNETPLSQYFLTSSSLSQISYAKTVELTKEVLLKYFASLHQPYSGKSISELTNILKGLFTLDQDGIGIEEVLNQVGEKIVQHSVNVNHPNCIAHLHCPPLIASLAAEMIISATNQSMDSWDQSPSATLVEQRFIQLLCQLYKLSEDADGVFTSGGTQSNFMGLLLARDYATLHHLDWSISLKGLPPEAKSFRILCSLDASFTIRQSARLLGLGDQAIITVDTDQEHCLSIEALVRHLDELKKSNLLPIALVATAGTTDFGSIDPLDRLAACAKENDLWFHIDASFGGALILSRQHQHRLDGIEQMDSLAVDFHKLFYQPISCGAFLVRNRDHFKLIQLHADYLNPKSNEELGIPDLVGKSIQTTRRFDALKILVAFRAYGQNAFERMIDTTIQLAQETAHIIQKTKSLELVVVPSINTVVFRYCPTTTPSGTSPDSWSNEVNTWIRMELLHQGYAVIGYTKINGLTYLKFTLLNPLTRLSDIKYLIRLIQERGTEKELRG